MSKPTIEMYWNENGSALYKDGEPYVLYRELNTSFEQFLLELSKDCPEGFNFVYKDEIDDETLENDFY